MIHVLPGYSMLAQDVKSMHVLISGIAYSYTKVWQNFSIFWQNAILATYFKQEILALKNFCLQCGTLRK